MSYRSGFASRSRRWSYASIATALWASAVATTLAHSSAAQQSCDDANDCTVEDICSLDGSCHGTPKPDGSPCSPTLFGDCVISAQCMTVLNLSFCVPVESKDPGTPCTIPGLTEALGQCLLDAQCTEEGLCQPNVKTCETPQDLCAEAFCDPSSGECQTVSKDCTDACSSGTCDPQTGECVNTQPVNEGLSCDDANPCTSDDRCQTGECRGQAGGPVGTVTPTSTPPDTPTTTPPNTPTNTVTPSGTSTSTPTTTVTSTLVPTGTPTSTPTTTVTNTPMPTGTLTTAPTNTSTPTPTETATTGPTGTLTNSPTTTPTVPPALTETPTNTPTGAPTTTSPTPPPTSTATNAPTSTLTPTVGMTPTVPGCVGDCNGDNEVTIDEIIKGVNIALGYLPLDDCPSFDSDGNGSVTVNEIIRAVLAALEGCPS